MEKQLIEQLLTVKIIKHKVQNIVDQLGDNEPEHDLYETTLANACGLR